MENIGQGRVNGQIVDGQNHTVNFQLKICFTSIHTAHSHNHSMPRVLEDKMIVKCLQHSCLSIGNLPYPYNVDTN